MLAQEEDNQHTGAGVGADYGSDITGDDILYAVLFPNQRFQSGSILGAVTVGNEGGVEIDAGFAHLLNQQLHGSLTAANLGGIDEMTVVVNVDDGFDVQHGAHHGGGGADTAAPLQMSKVIHGDPVADVQLVFFNPVPQGIDVQTLVPLVAGIPYQQTLAQGSAEAVHHIDLPVGIGFPQILGGNDSGLVSSGKTGGEGNDQYIFAVFQCFDLREDLVYRNLTLTEMERIDT